jgi:RNA polymerase sigma factor (sigma-70 family)
MVTRVDRRAMARLMEPLTPQQLVVLNLRYALDGFEEVTLSEVGRRLGVSPARVRQVEAKAITRMWKRARVLGGRCADLGAGGGGAP